MKERGVYEVDPPAEDGTVLLVVVDSAGHRIRIEEARPSELDLIVMLMWNFLDKVNPVPAEERRRGLLRAV